MAIERAPQNTGQSLETLKTFTPDPSKVGTWHTVSDGRKESFLSIAAKYNVSADKIFALNFPGSVVNGRILPEVVNWYLHYHQGYGGPETADKKNRMFRGGEKVAIPPLGKVIIEEPVILPTPPKRTDIWVGVGYKGGTTFGVVGTETAQIVCFSIDDFAKGFTATIAGSRFPAFGLGASGGPTVVLISSMQDSNQLRNLLTGDSGYSLSVGAKLKGLFGDPRLAKLARVLAEFAAKYGRAGAAAKQSGILLAKYHSEIVDTVKILKMDTSALEPQIVTFDVPVGGFGLEVGYQFVVSEYHVNTAW